MAGASEPDSVSTKRQRIAELAKQAPQMGFTSGCWRWTSGSSSTLWITPICATCSSEGYATGCCYVSEQHQTLSQKLQGHYNYYGITGNYAMLNRASRLVAGIWRKWRDRRSWRARFRWSDLWELLGRKPLPPPRVVHSVYRSGAKG